MMATSAFLLGVLALLAEPAAAQLPYNPARILRSSSDARRAYIFQPAPSSDFQFQLFSIDLAHDLDSANVASTLLSPSLPFLNQPQIAFTPAIDQAGNITVYTGDCSQGAKTSGIWRFEQDNDSKTGNGTWRQNTLEQADDAKSGLNGANYLAGGISFSSLIGGNASSTNYYAFGGMCPSSNATANTWQASATYSNSMLRLDPQASMEYDLGVVSSRGPPIAEAGFSLTGLQPTYSNNTDGTRMQQQSFVLLGGHTSGAFINMSQVALFTLPQETWTFLPVNQQTNGKTDEATRSQQAEVEPRSGHTAVLSPDGKSVVLLGGWIGDVATPAIPQLAVLHLGDGYGGQGQWSWTVPSLSGKVLADGAGIYGHGASMLPGGVMMVVGGYNIPAASKALRPRAAPIANNQVYFLNVTSGSWLSSYSPPAGTFEREASGPLSTSGQKAGLGVGMGVGAVAIVALVLFYFWYTNRLKLQREDRERELTREAHFTADDWGLPSSIDGRGGSYAAVDYIFPREPSHDYDDPHHPFQGWKSTNGREAERTGLLVEIPSPTRGLRRSLAGRPIHQARYSEKRRSRGSGAIHPIIERDEEESQRSASGGKEGDETGLEMSEKRPVSILSSAPSLDPFRDPDPLGSHPVSRGSMRISIPPPGSSCSTPLLTPAEERKQEVASWVNEWEKATEALLAAGKSSQHTSSSSDGRSSPTKSEGTYSMLSNASSYHSFSNKSSSAATGSTAASASVRSAALLTSLTSNTRSSPVSSPTMDQPLINSFSIKRKPAVSRHSRAAAPATEGSTSAQDLSTPPRPLSFTQLQAEGEALLLGGRPRSQSFQPYTDTPADAKKLEEGEDGDDLIQISEHRPVGRAPSSWVGNVRRVLGRSVSGRFKSSPGQRGGEAASPRWLVQQQQQHVLQRRRANTLYHDSTGSAASSPTKAAGMSLPALASAPPRRAASDASFLRRKQGAKDWAVYTDYSGPEVTERRSGDDWGAPEDVVPQVRVAEDDGGNHGGGDEDWDVEAAAEQRVVQVLFTVPKTRLRVVNAEVSDARSLVSREDVEEREREMEMERIEIERSVEVTSSPRERKGKGKE